MKEFTYDDIQAEAEVFAKTYRQSQEVPALPDGAGLEKYQQLLQSDYSRIVELVQEYVGQFDSEGGHGYEHLAWVATLAGWIAENECRVRSMGADRTDQVVRSTVLAGLLHDIDRHLGIDGHMQQGSITAAKLLAKANVDLPSVVVTVANHDRLDFVTNGDEDLEIVFGSVFDADHFRYGLEREDTFWRMKEKKGKPAQEVIYDYQYLPAYRNAWRTAYGKEVGPKFIDFGLAIAKHVEEFFGK